MILRGIFGPIEAKLPDSVLIANGVGRFGKAVKYVGEEVVVESYPNQSLEGAPLIWRKGRRTVVISGFLYDESVPERWLREWNDKSAGAEELGFCEGFLCELDGEFAGLLICEDSGQVLAFSNRCGTVPLYISCKQGVIACSTHLVEHARLIRSLGWCGKISSIGMQSYLSQGGMLEDETLLEDTMRILPGNCALYSWRNGRTVNKQYCRFERGSQPIRNFAQAVERIDESFEKAVQKQYQFDVLHVRKHLGSLSGGLDARMDAVVARDLGFHERTNLTFGNSGCDDMVIASKIASEFGQEHITISLDSGDFIKESLDTACLANGGISLAVGSTHGIHALSLLDLDRFGILHTGTLGDAIFGSYLSGPLDVKPLSPSGAYSRFRSRTYLENQERVAAKFEHQEIFKLYTRGFLTINGGTFMMSPYVMQASPFLDTEVVKAVLDCSTELRWSNRLYFEWIAKRRRAAAQFPYDKTGFRPLPASANVRRGQRVCRRLLNKAEKRMGKERGMNPFASWYQSNERLRSFIDTTYQERCGLGEEAMGKEWESVSKFFENANAMEQLQVISLLGTMAWLAKA